MRNGSSNEMVNTSKSLENAQASVTPVEAPTPTPGMLEQFNLYSPLAAKIAIAEVRPMRLDAELVVFNAAQGAAMILGYRDQVTRELSTISFDDIAKLPAMGQALQYADGKVDRMVQVPTEARAVFSQASKARKALLDKATVAANEGLLSAAAVTAIRHGHGPVDTANDCVALAALFFENASALAGKVHVTADEIKNANDVGAKLLSLLKPEHARKPASQQQQDAMVTRDRMWTLFEQTWERNVWRAGAWLFGREVGEHIPLLGTRVRASRKPVAPAPSPTPSPAPVPTPSPTAPMAPTVVK